MKQMNRSSAPEVPQRPVKVLQFGEGNFLRGFVDWIIDILNEHTDFHGDIQIVQPLAKGMGKAINSQDGLYHVLLEGVHQNEKIQKTRLITSVRGVLNPYEDYDTFLKMAENPDLEFIISNTTEAGISFDTTDKSYASVPKSFPGKLTAMLHHRYRYFEGTSPTNLIILPCELIEKNGEKLRECILKYSEHWSLSENFKQWITKNVIFCNTLVDRIVPGFPKEDIANIQNKIGYEDLLVVKAEPFHLWVIEGPDKIRKQLPISKSGLNIVLTQDLSPYRTRKVRILNGAHTAIVPVAYLNGFREVLDVVEDEKMGTFLNQIIRKEIIPTLDFPKAELETYASAVLDRFRNPFISHALLDIALNSISKFKVRVLPSILTYIENYEKAPEGLISCFAHFLFFHGGGFGPEPIPLRDDEKSIAFFKKAWATRNTEQIVEKVLSNTDLWDINLYDNDVLRLALTQQMEAIRFTKKKRAQF